MGNANKSRSVERVLNDIITSYHADDFIICRSPAKLPGAQEFKIRNHDKNHGSSEKDE
jgi:hypothetical protein